jgi:hypothetical protein
MLFDELHNQLVMADVQQRHREQLDRRPPLLLEGGRDGLHHVQVVDAIERRAAPQLDSATQQLGPLGSRRKRGAVNELCELVAVEPVTVVQYQSVATLGGDDPVAHQATKARDRHPRRTADHLSELIKTNVMWSMSDEHPKQPAPLWRQDTSPTIELQLDRAKNADSHPNHCGVGRSLHDAHSNERRNTSWADRDNTVIARRHHHRVRRHDRRGALLRMSRGGDG